VTTRAPVEHLERAVELTVDDPTIIEHLADAYDRAGRIDRAVARYRESLKFSKDAEQSKRLREKIQRLERKT
jgi:Flp pilus assembly protein TadD